MNNYEKRLFVNYFDKMLDDLKFNYYAFAFYEPAEKYYNDVDYYIKEGRDFVYVGPVRTQTEFEKDQY